MSASAVKETLNPFEIAQKQVKNCLPIAEMPTRQYLKS